MGSSAKGGGSTTITQDNEPPKWAAPLFKQSAKVAQNLYKSGAGFNIYPGSTVAAPSADTKLGAQGLANLATAPESYDLGQNPVYLTNQMLSQGGLMAPAQQAMGFFGDVAGGQHNIGTGGDYRDIYGRAQQPGAAEDYLTATARGDYIEDGNPHFRALLDREVEDIGDRVSGIFAGGGRYGSGAHQGVLGETTSDFMLKGLSEDFNRERAAQMQAAQAIEQAQQGRLGQQMGAVGGMTGVAGQNLANRLGAASQGADLSNQGLMQALGFINALPTIQQNRTFAPNLLLQSGAVQDQANQAQINDMVSRFYQQDMQPWTRLGALQAAAQGSAGAYGTMHRESTEPGPSPLGILGSLVTGISGMPGF